MKSIFYFLPFLVGVCTVLQGALNKRIALDWGLSWALMWTSLIVIVLSGLLIWGGWYPGKMNIAQIKWWHFLPGIFGFLVILCIPISIEKIGALNSFLILVTSQLIVSGAWDYFVEGVALSWTRVMGSGLALLGAWLASR